VNYFVGAFHDAVLLYAMALNKTLEVNGSLLNGLEVTHRMWNVSFNGRFYCRLAIIPMTTKHYPYSHGGKLYCINKNM